MASVPVRGVLTGSFPTVEGMSTSPYQQAVIDWVVAHGTPLSTFGPGGRITEESERALLAQSGIDYEGSTAGDLAGQTWSCDTYDEAQAHPGLWAEIVPLGARPDSTGRYRDTQRWFVEGEQSRLTLTDVITGVLEAGQVGDLYWRIKVAEAESRDA
jgi:hypothetical protein